MTEPRYHYGIIPNSRRFPRTWSDWLRPAAVVLVAVLVVSGVTTAAPWLIQRLGCHDGLPSADIYSSEAPDGSSECVGITDGSYVFGLSAEFESVLSRIRKQNENAARACGAQPQEPVKIGVLTSLTHPNSGSRALHELEGFAAGQARANQPGCVRPLQLLVAHTGKAEQAAVDLARRFRANRDVMAVVGLGLSGINAANAANVLGAPIDENNERPVPMVSDVITAEGFDSDGTTDAHGCDYDATFRKGIGGNYFFRVSFRNGAQVDELAKYLGAGNPPMFIVTPDNQRDPYTCTTLQRVRALYRQQQPQVQEVLFSVDNQATVPQVARRVCGSDQAVSVFYAARSRDLGRFLAGLAERYDRGVCEAESITVVSTSDAARMRVPEMDKGLETPRERALQSPAFADGRLRLLYTPLADPDVLRRGEAGGGLEFAELARLFDELDFAPAHLDDGWAINAYDSVFTVTNAVNDLDSNQTVTRDLVRGAIAGFSAADEKSTLSGANGRIGFENNGNRAGAPVIVRLCPPGSAVRTHTVTTFGAPGDRTPCQGPG
ncbi:MAG TPA: ABC transporter substrate-binding protein [Pseudonocardiaceae bacterium]|nr:ABC transporter substrate-binding protein [Pseudonocardiaceae bacterium]